MKIIHLSRSVWQPEAPFHNVMHTIMHAQCGGHWETLVVVWAAREEKKKTSVVMSPEFEALKKGEK